MGRGDFGVVYKVRSRSDNKRYAVKKSMRPFRGANDRNRSLKEVETFTTLGSNGHANAHCVRYYGAWEDKFGHLFIQTELFERG
jgi:mitosis inhibitor protein kinase SWE1